MVEPGGGRDSFGFPPFVAFFLLFLLLFASDFKRWECLSRADTPLPIFFTSLLSLDLYLTRITVSNM
jgi:hypothetical protein